jgi:hypothetical protein
VFVLCSRLSVYISQSYSKWAASIGLESKKFDRSLNSAGMLLFVGVVCVASIIFIHSLNFTSNLLYNISGLALVL